MNDYINLLSAVAEIYGRSLSETSGIIADAVADLNARGVMANQIDVMRSTLQAKGIIEFTTPDNITYYTGPVSSSGNVGAMINANGSVRGYTVDYSTSVAQPALSQGQQIAQEMNSNLKLTEPAKTATYTKMPVNTELVVPSQGAASPVRFSKLKSAAGNALSFVTGEVLPAIAATSVGIQAGKWLAPQLYDLAPDFWEALGIDESSFDPSTWNSLTSGMEDTFLGRTFNTIFGIDPETNTSTMYLDSNVIAYLLKILNEGGVFAEGQQTIAEGDTWSKSQSWYNRLTFPIPLQSTHFVNAYPSGVIEEIEFLDVTKAVVTSSLYTVKLFKTENSTFTRRTRSYNPNTGWSDWRTYTTSGTRTYENGKPVAYASIGYSYISPTPQVYTTTASDLQLGYTVLYGVPEENPVIPGVTTQPDATLPDFSRLPASPTINDYRTIINNTYPELEQNKVTQSTVLPDGTVKTTDYYPMPYPNVDIYTDETTGKTYIQPTSTLPETPGEPQPDPISQGDTTVDPDTAPETQTQPLSDALQNPPIDDGDDIGTGSSPETVAVTGSASSLWAVYNPTQSEVNAFGAWLWSPNFVDQLLKLFNDPMQSIIGIHKVFASPHIGGTRTIVVGYLDSGVGSKYVSSQYTTVDCGTVNLSELYQNVYDYSPYTEVSIYLPFIGIHQLDVGDVMRSSISVIYHVDVISGACLAEVKVSRDGNTAVLYQYSGNASVTYPISSGSYMGMISAVASIAGAAIATVASGGSALPLAMGAANAALNARTRVSHSGSFSGNAGAMGCKTPYLIITRPQTAYADGIETLHGIGASSVLTVGECTGFIQASDVDLTGIAATSAELSEIRALLLSGIYV